MAGQTGHIGAGYRADEKSPRQHGDAGRVFVVGAGAAGGCVHADWLADINHNLYANGIRTILATPSAARPAWLAHKYPEVRRVRADRMLYFQWRASRGAEEKFHGAVVGHDGRQDARAFTETVQVGENWKNCLKLQRYSAKNKR